MLVHKSDQLHTLWLCGRERCVHSHPFLVVYPYELAIFKRRVAVMMLLL